MVTKILTENDCHLHCADFLLLLLLPKLGAGEVDEVSCRGEGWDTGMERQGATGGLEVEPAGHTVIDWRLLQGPAETIQPHLTRRGETWSLWTSHANTKLLLRAVYSSVLDELFSWVFEF